MATSHLPAGTRFSSDVPPRLDRLSWSPWHTKLVIALGITWMLDGLEVTLVGSVAAVLAERDTLGLSASEIGAAGTLYLAGAILGALVFGRLTDRFGRRRLFLVTLGLYVGATLLTAVSWSFASFAVFRALTGAGIGGEYSAVNSAIDELIPARLRGRIDLAVNGTFWLGAALGACMALWLLGARWMPHPLAWRSVFLLGAVLGTAVLFLRRHVPESPRWLLLHGRVDEADQVMSTIEKDVGKSLHRAAAPQAAPSPVELEATGSIKFLAIARVLLRKHARRTCLGLALMVAQAFAYNGVFFTYALVLGRLYGVPSARVAAYLLPFSIANLLGPWLLGGLFDVIGRRVMIAATYTISGLFIAVTGFAMFRGWLDATSQTLLWCGVFFVASAAASSAYLTVSELFPVEMRGMAIALFYAAGTALGGMGAPILFGVLLDRGDQTGLLEVYLLGAALMVLAGVLAAVLGVSAERRSLEELVDLEA
ncbi:MAG TPA: MFS transporter [Polyangiaceae bacterium]|jgi:MFS family permease